MGINSSSSSVQTATKGLNEKKYRNRIHVPLRQFDFILWMSQIILVCICGFNLTSLSVNIYYGIVNCCITSAVMSKKTF